MYISDIQTFIEGFPSGNPEREYHEALFEIVEPAQGEASDLVSGLGLLLFINSYDFVGAGINTMQHPIAGSDLENATFVAHLYHHLGKRPEWWKAEALRKAGEEEVIRSREDWKKYFESSGAVKKVYPPY